MARVNNTPSLVYVPMCADIVHAGHMNIINQAKKHGDVVIGLLSDEAVTSKKRLPVLPYEQRLAVMTNITGVSRVIKQETPDYRPNLEKLRPAFVVHGDDWSENARSHVIASLAQWGGKLIEVPYTKGISSTLVRSKLDNLSIPATDRLELLSRMLDAGQTVRVLEAHNGISARVVDSAEANVSGKTKRFDAIWISSLTDSVAKGKPDTELIDVSSRLATINEVLEVSNKPLLVDGDTGGHAKHFAYTVRTLERLGVSAVVIEDKTGLKRNSLHENPESHIQEDMNVFAQKIQSGLQARTNNRFLVIARIESLVLGKGLNDALERADCYIKAGASAIMIHSKNSNGKDIKKFAEAFAKLSYDVPLMLIPTSYASVPENELEAWGGKIIVYANQLLRAAYPAMQNVAVEILKSGSSHGAKNDLASVEELLKLVEES